jgi:glycerate 2-kinase
MARVRERPVLVAPEAFGAAISAATVAGAIGRGLERAGLMPPDLCPLTAGGSGTLDVLLPRLGGELASVGGLQVALLEDGAAALVEEPDGELLAAAVESGAAVVVVAAGAAAPPPGVLPGARLVVLCGPETPREAWAAVGATVEPGLTWLLGELEFDARMRASRALVTGTGRLDEGAFAGVVGEVGTRARQAGVPLHALVGVDALDAFAKRIIDLQVVREAGTIAELEAAAEELGAALATGAA